MRLGQLREKEDAVSYEWNTEEFYRAVENGGEIWLACLVKSPFKKHRFMHKPTKFILPGVPQYSEKFYVKELNPNSVGNFDKYEYKTTANLEPNGYLYWGFFRKIFKSLIDIEGQRVNPNFDIFYFGATSEQECIDMYNEAIIHLEKKEAEKFAAAAKLIDRVRL